MKIYIIGPTGSGKTTLSERLSKKYNIKCYELDLLVYDDDNNHIKRLPEVRDNMFNEILKKKSWIIEDVGRQIFKKGRQESDIIYYINIPRIIVYKRVITRWLKQRLGKERYNYPPTFKYLIDMLKITKGYFKKEQAKINSLSQYKDKVVYLNYKDIKNLEKTENNYDN